MIYDHIFFQYVLKWLDFILEDKQINTDEKL